MLAITRRELHERACHRPEPQGIVGAVRKGILRESVLDRALQRLFMARIRLGSSIRLAPTRTLPD